MGRRPAQSLVVIGSGPDAWGWAPIDATMAHWPQSDRPTAIRLPMASVLEDRSLIDRCGVAWVVLDDSDPDHWHELLGFLQERQIPVMLSRPNETQPAGAMYKHGVVVGPAESAPETLCLVLRTLWTQSGVIQGLQADILLLRAHQGGLCGQIDKIDEELRMAAQLQREFMPTSLPSHRAVEFHVLFRPAGYVSGDVYDVVRLDDRHMAFFLADAVGHGVPAALLTMHIKHTLRAKQIVADISGGHRVVPPPKVLAQLNEAMMAQPGTKMRFASACYGIIDCQTLQLTFARAGHPFPILMRATGATEYLDPEGTLLGIFPDKKFEPVQVQLHPGDRLLLYSDGIEMAFGYDHEQTPDAPETIPAYTEELMDLAHGPIDEAVRRFERKLDRQVGSLSLRDDLTVVCLGIRPEALSGIHPDQTLAKV